MWQWDLFSPRCSMIQIVDPDQWFFSVGFGARVAREERVHGLQHPCIRHASVLFWKVSVKAPCKCIIPKHTPTNSPVYALIKCLHFLNVSQTVEIAWLWPTCRRGHSPTHFWSQISGWSISWGAMWASICPKIRNPKPTCFSTTIEHIDHIGVEDQPIHVTTQFSLCLVRSFFLFQDVAVRRHTPGIQIALQFLQSLTAGNLQVAPLPGNIQGTRKVEGWRCPKYLGCPINCTALTQDT